MGTRRRIVSLIAGAALIGGMALAGSSQAATVVCPPGCVAAGVVKAAGGQPDPTSLSLYGDVMAVISTLTGDVANVATVAETYHLSVYGSVAQGAAGTLSGTVTFHASRFDGTTYRSLTDSVAVSGTVQQLKLEGSKVRASLTRDTSGYTGAMVYADVKPGAVVPGTDVRCKVPSVDRLPSSVPEATTDLVILVRETVASCRV